MSVNVKQNGQLTKVAGLYEATAPMGIADCYSTEERLVGCWTNGKPLYQRSFHYSGTADNADFQVTIATLDATIEMKHILNGGLYRGGSLFNPTIYAPSDIYFRYIYNPSDYTLGLRVGASLNTTIEATVTIQYTKTTDVAGSGIWTPNGDYAEHYTTDEQVIGTYLGETLYQKTFRILKSDFTNTGTNTYSYSWSLPFNSIVSINAIMKTNNAFVQIPNGTINQNYSNYISSITTSAFSMFMNATNVYANLQYVDITLKYTKAS